MRVPIYVTEEQLALLYELVLREYELYKDSSDNEYRVADLLLLRTRIEDIADTIQADKEYQYKNREFEKSK